LWRLAIPLLKFHPRLAEGLAARTLREKPPHKVDVWIQSASVGESFLACELVNALQPVDKCLRIFWTANTRQGVEILQTFANRLARKRPSTQIFVSYFPLDRPALMKRAVQILQPGVTVLLETEIWPGLLAALKSQGRHCLIINGRLSPKSLTHYQWMPWLWPRLKPDRILAISPDDADRFATLFDMPSVEVMPNIKFDRCHTTAPDTTGMTAVLNLRHPEAPLVVLASVRKAEESDIESMLLEIRKRYPAAIIGLVPRHQHRLDHWEHALNRLALPWKRRSKTTQPAAPGTILLWDTFGELTALYTCASAAFVGGSLAPLGGHNFLEALFAGIIPVTGPYWNHFKWVGEEIVTRGLLQTASNWQEAADMICTQLESALPRETVRQKALHYIARHRGGTAQACRLIQHFLKKNHP
jgi:3-deoxy-D-manno-octulosonic-acid transferase